MNYFNSGSGSRAAVALAGFKKEDETRVKEALRKVSIKARRSRRKLRGEKKAKSDIQGRLDCL